MSATHLAPNSPCRDAGFAAAGVSPFDLDGTPRVVGLAVDIGADEVPDIGFPGTADDLALFAWTNGVGDPLAPVRPLGAGDLAMFRFVSPAGSLTGTSPLIAAQFFPDWLPPTAPVIAGVWLDAGAFVVFGASTGAPFLGLPVDGIDGMWSVPPGLDGLRLRVQGFATTSLAANGLFAATNAVEFDL